ncbi:hypothetical protein [Variovorax paradoxus]|uniref:hypothetical protein n=1 Tax=Variovorax paradoxus TaxID=34073 RepID=UPI00285F3A97|nr:hypothetical protein [Variovorax paradoxus]MDR6455494.1 putative nucleic acid-binding Zn-ribbon protein [Variovorax paradoxus]
MDQSNPTTAPAVPLSTPSPVVDLSPEQNAPATNLTPQTGVQEDEVAKRLNAPDWVDVANATWQIETITGQNLLGIAADPAGPDSPSQTFDPFAYFGANRERFGFLAPFVAHGVFDNVRSEAQFQRYAEKARQNIEARELIARGDGGSTIANMAVSLLDLPTILSFGALGVGMRATSLAARAAVGGTAGFLDAAVAEAALQGMDPTRKGEEAFMNIGTGTFIGAGMGPLFRHLPPDSALRPGHPENPMRVEAEHPVVEHRVGQTPEEAGHVGGSAGAMAVRTGDDRIATGGTVSSALDKVLSAPTPLGRMNGYSGSGQSAIAQLYDLGGLMLEKNKRGIAHAPEAEAYVVMYKHEGQALIRDMETTFRETAVDLGSSNLGHTVGGLLDQATLGAVDRRALPRQQFFDLVDEQLAARMTNNVRADTEALEALKALGLGDQEAAKALAGVKKAAESATRFMDSMMDEAERIGLADPKLRKQNYGKPMMYINGAIDQNQGAMRAIALRHFTEKPSPEFLIEHGYIKDPNAGPVAPSGAATTGPAHADWKSIVDSGDLKLQGDILTHWRGAMEDAAAEEAAQRVISAQQKQLRATQEFEAISDGLDGAKADLKDANLKMMRARVRESEANWQSRNLASLTRSAEQAEAKVNDVLSRVKHPDDLAEDLRVQMAADGYKLDQQAARVRAAERPVSEAEAVVDSLKGEKAPHVADREALSPLAPEHWQSERDLAHTQEQLARINSDLRDAYAARRAAQADLRTARAEFEATAAQQRLTGDWKAAVDKEVQRLIAHEGEAVLAPGFRSNLIQQRERLDALRRAYDDAVKAWREAGEVYRGNRAGLKVSRKELAQTTSALRKAVFRQKRVEGATPLSQYVDSWVDSMRGADRAPGGMLLDRDPRTGRLQERTIEWSTQELKELKRLGFVETDVTHMMERYAQDMGGEIALHKAFGGKSREDVLRDMNSDYQALIEKATDPKEIARLNKARKANEEDIVAGWDRIKGRHDLTDNNGLTWFADKIGRIGLLRYMGGFIFSAAGDIATAAMAARGGAGGFMKYAVTAGKDFRYILEQARKGDPGMKELAKILGTFENAAHMATSDRALGRGSAADLIGFGTGRTREVTGKVDKYLGLAADKANALSLLRGFSDSVRRSAGLVQLANLAEWTKKGWSNLDAGKQADLLALGIGQNEAKRLGALFEKHATVHENGLVSPNMHKWLKDPEGTEMADLLTTALEKTQRRASYTSGMGHQPLLMDKWYGKLFLQFQSYAFQFYSNFMRTGAQRMALTPGDAKAYQASALALAAGVLTAEIAYWRKGEKPDRESKAYAYSIIQRSGILGWTGSYTDAGVKLLAPTVAGNASKYSQNSWLSNMLGPGMGTIETLSGLGADAARGEWSDAGKKAKTLVPMRQQYDLLNRLFGNQP